MFAMLSKLVTKQPCAASGLAVPATAAIMTATATEAGSETLTRGISLGTNISEVSARESAFLAGEGGLPRIMRFHHAMPMFCKVASRHQAHHVLFHAEKAGHDQILLPVYVRKRACVAGDDTTCEEKARTCLCTYKHICTYIYIYMYICVDMYIYVCICVCTCMYVCMYVCMCICACMN